MVTCTGWIQECDERRQSKDRKRSESSRLPWQFVWSWWKNCKSQGKALTTAERAVSNHPWNLPFYDLMLSSQEKEKAVNKLPLRSLPLATVQLSVFFRQDWNTCSVIEAATIGCYNQAHVIFAPSFSLHTVMWKFCRKSLRVIQLWVSLRRLLHMLST